MFFDKLSQKAYQLLRIVKDRFYNNDDEQFLKEDVRHHAPNVSKADAQTEETIFDILRRTYMDIAESDPEAALTLIKEEIEAQPPIPIRDTLLDIERDIRRKYSDQYFGGKRKS